ncbi:hypothetical protein [Microbispora sp. H10830]|uniref:hypothetical protein n=1 Tax=Microbispora sp. H10830 TaxID=2729109 RepID=UPI001602801F|nr:hypothetical protein [Microbispora sp. H10830]
MPDFSPTPRHRRDGHPVLALTGVIGVTAIAGLGVVLAVLPARDPAPSAARPVAADLGTAVSPARPAPGFPAAGPFFPPATAPRKPGSERPETEPERAAEHREETGEAATRDDPENAESEQSKREQPERERPARRGGALPPGHETGASRSSGRPDRTAGPSSRSRPPSPVSSSRSGGSDSTGAAGRAGTRETHRPRPARVAPPDASKPAVRSSATGDPAGHNTTENRAENTAAENPAAKDAAARDTGTRGTAVPRAGADGVTRTRIQDPCLRFDDDLRRAYCYEVLSRLGR